MLKFQGKEIETDQGKFHLPHSILDAEYKDGKVYVVYDYMEFPKNAPAHNLVCLDLQIKQLWVAENPTSLSSDAYTNFAREVDQKPDCIAVYNFAGYLCYINQFNGKVLNAIFTK